MNVNIEKMVASLKNGEIILHKTDTIWGLGCDASNEKALNRIKEIKERPSDKSFIILISDISQLNIYVDKVPDIAWDLVEFAEKPLTVVYPKGKNLPASALAEDGSIAIRLVKDVHCKELIYKFGKAIASTSANISGESSPTNFESINEAIKSKVDFIEHIEGKVPISNPSTIVKLGLNGDFSFIRK
ncbi:MAG: L-threonylcarbamoyladenylate synthase [Bacteroidota bacterium]